MKSVSLFYPSSRTFLFAKQIIISGLIGKKRKKFLKEFPGKEKTDKEVEKQSKMAV